MAVYYNEINPTAVLWLQAAMDAGIIAKGDIDTRSIEDVKPTELLGYTQCHFFAGIGGWSIALRLAGWPDDRPVWTGSCPCQSFSTAGKGLGRDDPRHLWPAWFWLIQQCRPERIYGEQVANAITHGWWDDVATDLEAEGYACGAAVLPACSVGRPHKRDRLWFVADGSGKGLEKRAGITLPQSQQFERPSALDDAFLPEHSGEKRGIGEAPQGVAAFSGQEHSAAWEPCRAGEHVANAQLPRLERHGGYEQQHGAERRQELDGYAGAADLQWIDCPDGKQRLVESSICLLADGISGRLRKAALHGYGNAIVPEVAAEFILATTN